MIKYSELQIGDYVLVGGKPRQVQAVTKKKIGFHIDKQNDKRLYYARLKELEPIAITKELLAANNFVENLCYWDYHIDEHLTFQYYFHEHRVEKYWYGRDEWQNNKWFREVSFMAQCWYLHELQHACKMSGVNIDWKVKI